MKKIVLLVSLFTSLLILVGCSNSAKEEELKQAEQQRQVERLTLVSSGEPSKVLPAFNTFTWNEDFNRVLSARDNSSESQTKNYLRNQIIQYLATKGYVFEPDPAKADVVIGFLFALEGDVADEQIQQRFGLLPGLNADGVNDPRYEKGSFLLAVISTDLQKYYWRSAVQGLVDLENGLDDPSNERMQGLLSMMLGRFPQAGR
ncbi:MAG: DUF4136 domain-containing protein [Psychromonas sp.]